MVQILGLKREIRIAFSQNGSIRLLKWNRNVIRNQCIRTCLDISTIPLHTFSLSPALALYVSRSITFSLTISIIPTTVWRTSCGLGLNVESCRPSHDCLPASYAGSTMEDLMSVKRRKGKNKIHSTSYASHFHSLCAFNVWKRIAERMSRSTKKKEIGKDRQLSLLCLACHTTMCMVDN